MAKISSDSVSQNQSLGGVSIKLDSTPIEYANEITVNASGALLGITGSADFAATSFTTVSAGNFGRAGLQLYKVGSPTGDLVGELWSFDGTNPDVKLAESTNTVDVAGLASSDPGAISHYFNFSSIALTDATKYVFAFKGSSLVVDGSNAPVTIRQTSSIYSGGAYLTGSYSNIETSVEDGSGRDIKFVIDYIS